MTATGACQTPLEGNALASGCSGCDGKAVYATITQFITGKEWYDNFEGLLMEDVDTTATPAPTWADAKIYAYGGSMAAKEMKINDATSKFNVKVFNGASEVDYSAAITAGNYTLKTAAQKKDPATGQDVAALEGKKDIA